MTRWRTLCVGLVVAAAVGEGLCRSDAEATPNGSAETELRRAKHQLTVQIAGRFCRYQRADVKAALGEVWSVDAVEFLNEDGTVRVFFEQGYKSPAEVAEEVEHALSLGLLCTATVERGQPQQSVSLQLLQVRH